MLRLTTFALLVFCLLWFGLLPHLPAGSLHDFGSFVASGRAARSGSNPYGVHELTYRTPDGPAVNLNPPISVLLFQVLAPLDPFTTYRHTLAHQRPRQTRHNIILRLLTDDELRRRIACQGHQTIQQFTWPRAVDAFEQCLLRHT
jgi:hypothetical protein